MNEKIQPIKIVYLHHPDDESIFEVFSRHLEGLRRDNLIEEWLEPLPGATFQEEIKLQLEKSDVIILFMTSSFEVIDRHSGKGTLDLLVNTIRECFKKGSHIWPIIAKPYHWGISAFREYELFWDRAITLSQRQDEMCWQIAIKITNEVNQLHSKRYQDKGDELFHQARLDEARLCYEQALSFTPDYLPALFGIGKVLRQLGHNDESKLYFEKSVVQTTQIQQKRKDALYGNQQAELLYTRYRGYALFALGRFQEAIATFKAVYPQSFSSLTKTQRHLYAEIYAAEGDVLVKQSNKVPNFILYYNQALTAYENAKKCDSANPKYPNRIAKISVLRGERLQSHNDYKQALDLSQHLIQTSPDYVPAYVVQGDALYGLSRFEEALQAYETALELDQYHAPAYAGKGNIFLAKNKSQEALSAFGNALFLKRNNDQYHYGRGRALAQLGLYREALSSFDQADNYGLKSNDLHMERAAMFLKLGDAEMIKDMVGQAIHYYENASSIYNYMLRYDKGKKYTVHCGLGNINFAYKNWDQALQHFSRAIQLAPSIADAYLGMGKVLIKQGEIHNAFAYLEYAHRHCSYPASTITEANIYMAYGNAFQHIAGEPGSKMYYENQRKAYYYYKKAAQTSAQSLVYFTLGKICALLHSNQEAIAAFDRALELDEQLIECYYHKGKCCFELGQLSEAAALYEKAICCGYDNASVRNAQGDTFLAMKEYMKAVEIFDNVISHLKDEMARAYCGKGKALQALGMNEDALKCFENANKIDPKTCLQPHIRRILQDICFSIESRLRTHPQDASAYKEKGDVLLLLDERMKDVVDAYNRAIAYGCENADVYYHRGEAYSRLHDYHKAVRDYRKTLDLDPHHPNAQQAKNVAEAALQNNQGNLFGKFSWLFATS